MKVGDRVMFRNGRIGYRGRRGTITAGKGMSVGGTVFDFYAQPDGSRLSFGVNEDELTLIEEVHP